MKLLVEIPNSIYTNISLIQRGSIVSKCFVDCVRNGQPLPDDCEILTKEAYEDLCVRASNSQTDSLIEVRKEVEKINKWSIKYAPEVSREKRPQIVQKVKDHVLEILNKYI